MKYIKTYSSLAERNKDKGNMGVPYIHYIDDGKEGKVFLISDKDKGYECVDLDLPSGLLWATCNVGASKPEEFGRYFSWADTIGYTATPDYRNALEKNNVKYYEGAVDIINGKQRNFGIDEKSIPYYNSANSTFTKYTYVDASNVGDNNRVLLPEDDAAHVNMGGDWRMPTEADVNELKNNTTSTITVRNNISGITVTSKINKENSIFLPFAGDCWGTKLSNVGSLGYLWTSTLVQPVMKNAFSMDYGTDNNIFLYSNERGYGFPIRGVIEKI